MLRQAAAAAGSALALTVGITSCSTVVPGDAVKDPAAPPPMVEIPDLKALMVSIPELETRLGATDLEVLQSGDTVSVATPEDGGVANLPECLGVMYPARETSYGGTGYTGVWGQRVGDNRTPSDHVVLQVVAAFPSVDKARAFFVSEQEAWKTCAGESVTTTFDSGVETFTMGQPTITDSTMTMVNPQEGGAGWACSRALGVKGNVVVDVNACQNGAVEQGPMIMDLILERIES